MFNFHPTKFKRLAFFLVTDIIIIGLSITFAFLLRFSGDIPNEFYKGLLLSGVALTLVKMSLMWIFRIYKVPWRFFGLYEARKIFYLHLIAAVVFAIIFAAIPDVFNPFPRSVIIIDAALSYIMISGIRISKRMFAYNRNDHSNNKPCIVIGATTKAIHVLNGMKQGHINYYAVGVVDGRKERIGTYCESFLVKSKSAIPAIIKTTEAKTAIIALALHPEELKELYDELTSYGLSDIKLFSLLESDSDKIRNVSIEDLLARKPKDLDSTAVKHFLNGKRVMVTGAGGTIGSEICKQCLEFGVDSLIMVDQSEYNLYKIDQITSDERNILKMVDISCISELEEIFSQYAPEVIVHAAAYKHVPLCEANPHSAVKNNILGTKNVIDLAKKYRVQKVVLISTDKAVRPTNIMGATKRVCELYALSSNVSGETEIAAVRFGNVLGSSGSVIPKFKAQIAQNRPLSVTHPDIVRYFMLVNEACQLVLQAASIAKGGELFVLDMGEPVKIVDLAKRMLQLAGKSDLGIEFVGLRPGEKLYEELLIDDGDASTNYESIFVASSPGQDILMLNRQISALLECKDGEVVAALKEIVPEFDHKINLKESA